MIHLSPILEASKKKRSKQEAREMPRRQQEYGQKETTRLLADGMSSVRESEEIAIATGDALRGQRSMLEGIRGDVDDMKNVSTSAAENIRQIERRVVRKRICLWSIILVLFVANIVVLVAMWKHGGKIFYREEAAAQAQAQAPAPPPSKDDGLLHSGIGSG